MKNRILAGIMSLCLVGGAVVIPNGIAPAASMTANAETEDSAEVVKSGKWGKSGTWSLDADGVLTISGEKTFGGLGDKLTNDEIKTVYGLVIEDGITDIAAEAFKGYSSLEYVTFPDTLKNIGDSAFRGCEKLYDVEFPDSLNAIGQSAFYGCNSLTSIVIPDSVTTIGGDAFCYTGLTSLTLGRGIISIGTEAFHFTSLKVAYYRGTEKEWENVQTGYSSVPDTIEFIKAGDANGDGKVSIADAVLIMQAISNPDEYALAEEQKPSADVVDAGGGLTPMDALGIQLVDLEIINADDLPLTSEELNNLLNGSANDEK